jgi:ABC-type lipoprotein export system ATPase subunit
MWEKLAQLTVEELLRSFPYAEDFFAALPDAASKWCTVKESFEGLSEEALEELGIERSKLIERFTLFMMHMETLQEVPTPIESITILGGHDKAGNKEDVRLTISRGEIICIVGSTGSGKSRLLADIEWLAQNDTPTHRQILLNGGIPEMKYRYAIEHKLVAQLSQNMNFIMDAAAGEFVAMHAASRMLDNSKELIETIIKKANELAGEQFTLDTPVTSLSGGQARALMIADTAYLSSSPIVLIDEIENAGIDRNRALELLVDRQKIVLLATHDPILALMGHKRLVIKNGAIQKVLETSAKERENLVRLEAIDKYMLEIRNTLRSGGRVDSITI